MTCKKIVLNNMTCHKIACDNAKPNMKTSQVIHHIYETSVGNNEEIHCHKIHRDHVLYRSLKIFKKIGYQDSKKQDTYIFT